MKNKLITKKYACDFETVVWENPEEQSETEVWASAWTEVGNDDEMFVHVANNIESWFDSMRTTKADIIYCYFHNLKFDGEFIIYYLHHVLHYGEATKNESVENKHTKELETTIRFCENKEMVNDIYKYVISDVGAWYSITIKTNNRIIEIRDSLKLIPLSIEEMGKAFNTKHRKLKIDYVGHMKSGELITPKEKAYIKNDVLVLSESLQKMFEQGFTRLTIGSNSMAQFRKMVGREFYENNFPDLTQIELDEEQFGSKTADEYIRKSYKGAFCWVNPINQGFVINEGVSADVNSLYPSQMHSSSGSYYPVGSPVFVKGPPTKSLVEDKCKYLFIRFTCGFKVKPNMIPTVQIKNNLYYLPNQWVETSMIRLNDGTYSDYMVDLGGNKIKSRVTFTMSETDFKMFVKHYTFWDLQIHDFCMFKAYRGIFDEFVETFMQQKIEARKNGLDSLSTIAKLTLNNLYGKFSASSCSSFKVFDYNCDEYDNMETIEAYDKKAGYIAIGSAITAYARTFIINQSMKFYPEKICYVDTDSLHIRGSAKDFDGKITIHPTNLNAFKIEGEYDKCYYFRQKFYIERERNNENYKLLICGMPSNCKEEINQKLISGDLELTDIKKGFSVGGKLIPKRIKGGIVLVPINFEVR